MNKIEDIIITGFSKVILLLSGISFLIYGFASGDIFILLLGIFTIICQGIMNELLDSSNLKSKNNSQEINSEDKGITSPSPPPGGRDQSDEGGYAVRSSTTPDTTQNLNKESSE